MWKIYVYGGGALMVGGIAGFVEAEAHRPRLSVPKSVLRGNGWTYGGPLEHVGGLSGTAYDLLLIAASALLVFGTLLALVGLMGYLREGPRTSAH